MRDVLEDEGGNVREFWDKCLKETKARTKKAGTTEAGTTEAGTTEAGTAEAGTAEAGTETGTPEARTWNGCSGSVEVPLSVRCSRQPPSNPSDDILSSILSSTTSLTVPL